MNKFLTFPNSRIPIWQEDFAFMQGCTKEALAFIVKAMMPESMRSADKVILCGCDFSQSIEGNSCTTTTTPGLVMIDGEIFEVQENSTESTFLSFVIDSTYDSSGNRTDADGNTRQCYNLRRAKIGDGERPDLFYIPRLNGCIHLSNSIELHIVNGIPILNIDGSFTLSPTQAGNETTVMSESYGYGEFDQPFWIMSALQNIFSPNDEQPSDPELGRDYTAFFTIHNADGTLHPAKFRMHIPYRAEDVSVTISILESINSTVHLFAKSLV